MRRRILTLAIAALPILCGLTIAGNTIAQADAGGVCIYSPSANPIAGYPTLPLCSSSRALKAQIVGSTDSLPFSSLTAGNDGERTSDISLSSETFGYGFNGTTWDRKRALHGETQITDGGTTLTKTTATACTAISNGAATVHRLWSAGTETQTLTLYTDSGCTAALWSGTPSSTPIQLDAPASAVYYKMGGTPAVNDYVTTN